MGGWVSGKDYVSTKFIRGRLRIFQLPTMLMDANVIASKPDATPEGIVYNKSGPLKRQAMIEHTVQDIPRTKANVILFLLSREGIF